jgi:CheY-like chemotaxis protein
MVILIVDDDPSIRTSLSAILRKEGHRVLEANGGVKGYNAVVAIRGDDRMVITDYNLPGMDGYTLAGAARKLYPQLLVLIVAGYTPTLGTSYPLLRKPFVRQDLLAAIRAATFGEAAKQPPRIR